MFCLFSPTLKFTTQTYRVFARCAPGFDLLYQIYKVKVVSEIYIFIPDNDLLQHKGTKHSIFHCFQEQ